MAKSLLIFGGSNGNTTRIVDAQLGSSDITHWLATAVPVMAKTISPGPLMFLSFSRLGSTLAVSVSASVAHLLRK